MKIGLTYTGGEEKHNNYVRWLKGEDDIEIVRLSAEEKNFESLKDCDALVLSGGVDIHPKFYGNPKMDYVGAPEQFNEARDEFEIAAYHFAVENEKPVLGICRGMQLINVIHNGTLVQNHEDDDVGRDHVGNPDKSHEVAIEKDSLLHEITGEENAVVNSAHHQAIARLGSGLVVNAKSDGEVVEGIELAEPTGKPFMLAVQWHPERMFSFNLENTAASKAIRDRFIDEIKRLK
ncbi:MAG: gamma-glutamyl-gamma-aminobutyrate hydrolase family protein [Bacteroidota bacterium]